MDVEKGKGVFFHPPISVVDTEDPDLDFPSTPKSRKVRFTYVPRDSKIEIIVTTDGFVAPVLKGSNDEILEFINVLIATAMSKGHTALFASTHDLCSFNYDRTTDILSIGGNEVFSLRNRIEFERDNKSTYSLWKQIPRDLVSMREIPGSWFDTAYKFYIDSELKILILLLGESWALAYDKSFKASFLYAWMIIETTLQNFRFLHIDSLNITEPEKKIIKNDTRNISLSIKLLHDVGLIDDTTFNSLEKIREKRNDIAHDITTTINSDDATNCMHIANEIIYNKFNKLSSPFVNIVLVK